MAVISESRDFNGFATKVHRLDLSELVAEAASTLDFPLAVEERKHANGTRGLRQTIDARFKELGGWRMVKVGGVDWTKSSKKGATIGVEVQVSGRSDMLAVDILHLKEKLHTGFIDAGLIIVPDDTLSRFLTDRTPNYATAIKHLEAGASELPIRVLAFRHDRAGYALRKMRTNRGRIAPEASSGITTGRKVAESDPKNDSDSG